MWRRRDDGQAGRGQQGAWHGFCFVGFPRFCEPLIRGGKLSKLPRWASPTVILGGLIVAKNAT